MGTNRRVSTSPLLTFAGLINVFSLTVPRTLLGLCILRGKLMAVGGVTNDHQVSQSSQPSDRVPINVT